MATKGCGRDRHSHDVFNFRCESSRSDVADRLQIVSNHRESDPARGIVLCITSQTLLCFALLAFIAAMASALDFDDVFNPIDGGS